MIVIALVSFFHMDRILGWFRRTPVPEDSNVIFEEITEQCFNECISSIAHPLSKRESTCVHNCALRKIELIKEFDGAIEKKLSSLASHPPHK